MAAPVICLGEYLVDRLFEGDEPPQASGENWTDYPGGAPANVATALAKLGTPSCLVSALGQDPLGDWLLQILDQQGVAGQIQRVAGAPTRTVLVQRDETGDRQFIGFSTPDPAAFADAHLSPDWVNTVDFAQVPYLVMGTLGLAYDSTARALARALDLAHQAGTKRVIDVNWRPVFWPDQTLAAAKIRDLLAIADLIKLSRDEALWLLGTDDATAIVQQFPHCAAVLLTDGANGSTCATQHHCVTRPAFQVDSIDTTGAGDAFLAGVIHQLGQRGWPSLHQPDALAEILRYASVVGALTTLKPGAIAAQPTAVEVEGWRGGGDREGGEVGRLGVDG